MPNKFNYCLNTSTISGQKLSLVEEIQIAARAGYRAIEPWIRQIIAYRDGGGSLIELKKRLADAGLAVPSAIGFAKWIVNDDAERAAGLEEARRDFDLVAQIGGTGIAAPPVGVQDTGGVDLNLAAEWYARLIDLGQQFGVLPMLEVWGFSKQLSRLGEALYVAAESNRPQACLLLDVYHLYKGGSGQGGLHLLSRDAVRVFHMNDYPAHPPRETINDAARVWPGDGVAPIKSIISQLNQIGFHGWLSLELFNESYWKMDAFTAAELGLRKMRAAVEGS